MYIAERIRTYREAKNLSQGDIEKRTGLLRCYISRVENGHTVPSIETLEKISRSLEVPLYQLLYDGEDVAPMPKDSNTHPSDWASSGKGRRLFAKLRQALARMSERDRATLLFTAGRLASNNVGRFRDRAK
jgi:transcriptional regulator with XRE-family HTH domain